MIRAEIIANQSVEDDIVEVLEQYIPDIQYTQFPLVTGRGTGDRKLGSTTWPETNFVLVAYVAESDVTAVKACVAAVKEKFPGEGIKLFLVQAIEG
jgi:hypothetical protein